MFARGYYWLTERLYNELAWAYDPVSWLVSLGQWDSWRKFALDYLVGTSILEIGFGTGELLVEMRRRKLEVIGLDPSAAMQRQATKKLRQAGIRLPLVGGAAQHMPFPDRTFDTIISTFPAGYIFDPATWREVARLLHTPAITTQAGGGRFIVVGICSRDTNRLVASPIQILFGQPGEEFLERFHSLAQSAGLHFQVITRRQGSLETPILIAERREQND